MARSAVTQLQNQIELIRREAYAAGYAAAMQAIRDFAERPNVTAVSPSRQSRQASGLLMTSLPIS